MKDSSINIPRIKRKSKLSSPVRIEKNDIKQKDNDSLKCPKYPAINCCGLKFIGRDGNIWTSTNYRWVKD